MHTEKLKTMQRVVDKKYNRHIIELTTNASKGADAKPLGLRFIIQTMTAGCRRNAKEDSKTKHQ